MLIKEAIALLESKYSTEGEIGHTKKTVRVYATDGRGEECDAEAKEALALWVAAKYGEDEDAYTVVAGFDIDGAFVEIDAESLAEFENEMKKTEDDALTAPDPDAYLTALGKDSMRAAEAEIIALEKSLSRSMKIALALSVGAFLLLGAIILLAIF